MAALCGLLVLCCPQQTFAWEYTFAYQGGTYTLTGSDTDPARNGGFNVREDGLLYLDETPVTTAQLNALSSYVEFGGHNAVSLADCARFVAETQRADPSKLEAYNSIDGNTNSLFTNLVRQTALADKVWKSSDPVRVPLVPSISVTLLEQLSRYTSRRTFSPVWRSGLSSGDETPSTQLWAQPFINHLKLSSAEGFSGTTSGISLGMDRTSGNWVYGGGYAFAATQADSGDIRTSLDINNLFGYLQYRHNDWYINTMLTAGISTARDKVRVKGATLRTATFHPLSFGAQVSAGRTIQVGEGYLAVHGGLRGLLVHIPDYTDSYQSRISTRDTRQLTPIAGLDYAHGYLLDLNDILTFHVRAAATYDLVSTDMVSVVWLKGANKGYAVRSDPLERAGLELGLGLTWAHKAMEFSLSYDASIRRQFASHSGMLQVLYNF